MGRVNYVSTKDEDFLRWSLNFISYLAPKVQQFNFTQEVSNSFQTQLADFSEKLNLADDSNTHTSVTVQVKNTARNLQFLCKI
jgi:hypothetical protein